MNNRFLNMAKAVALVTLIPIAALCISSLVSQSYQGDFIASMMDYARENNLSVQTDRIPDYRDLCATHNPEDAELCAPARQLEIFEFGALVSLAVGLGLFGLLALARLYAGHNRQRLAFVLPPLTRVMVLGLSLSIILQGAVAVFGIYIAETVFIGRVHFVVLAGIAFAAVIGGVNLVEASFKAMQTLNLAIQGVVIDNATGPDLIALVHEVADEVGARRPDNIVVGLEPSFFVTGAEVTVYPAAEDLTGSTLYLPVPFLRILSQDELRAVIGHEMGHFIGEDTEYSLKFYPAYARLETAMHALIDEHGRIDYVKVPTLSFLQLLHDEFSVVERKIGREREISADRIGAKVSNAKALATSLLKFSLFADSWATLRAENVDRLNQGEFLTDLNAEYVDVCQKAFKEMDFAERKNDLLAFEMAHPNDTHPTLRERLSALGIDSGIFHKEDMALANNPLTGLLTAYDKIAVQLTKAEHRKMIGQGFADPPSYAALRDD